MTPSAYAHARTDIAVVGAGPAGIAATVRAASSGASVTVIDDNLTPGGQIWRSGETMPWLERFQTANVQVISAAQVVSIDAPARLLLIETEERAFELQYRKLILATGARELFLPFPGWTLPGILGVGGLQALVKSGLPVRGKRIVIAGTGPLLLAVASHLRKKGAHIVLIAEQAPLRRLVRFAWHLLRHPAKIRQALALAWSLRGTPYRRGCWITNATGNGRLASVQLRQAGRSWTEPCDYAGVAYGLHPNTELASLAGCQLNLDGVAVNEQQETSVPGIFCAGESTGIGGVDLSIVEGEIAGYAATGRQLDIERLRPKFRAERVFARALTQAFLLRRELRDLPASQTFVCRCEDVRLEQIQSYSSFRAAKLHTRFGMGPCQGRMCGPAARFLLGWQFESIRPPLLASRVGTPGRPAMQLPGIGKKTMKNIDWHGVFPAITTPFHADLSIDHEFLAEHCQWLIDSGCKGIVALGSLGEGATLSTAEKNQVLDTCLKAVGDRACVVAGISALSTAEAVTLAQAAAAVGCHGLMVLPPYVYVGDWREMKAHVSAVFSATPLSCMLYNNPVAYVTDFLPHQVGELLETHSNLHAIKESSADVRRITALRAVAGNRLKIFCGVDDEIVEAVYAGADGWIAGLVNAFPKESVTLFELAQSGEKEKAFDLYKWFLPLLRMDTVPKFVQLIKFVQEQVGKGSQRVRPPRLVLTGDELLQARRVVERSAATQSVATLH